MGTEERKIKKLRVFCALWLKPLWFRLVRVRINKERAVARCLTLSFVVGFYTGYLFSLPREYGGSTCQYNQNQPDQHKRHQRFLPRQQCAGTW